MNKPLDRARRLFGAPALDLAGQLRRAGDEPLTRFALAQGRQVARLRLREDDARIVEVDVTRADVPSADSVALGPYVFETSEEARAFTEEATLALEYLGCEISSGPAPADA